MVCAMQQTFSLGKVLGIRVSANWSLFLIFGLLVLGLAGTEFPHSAPGHAGIAYLLAAVLAVAAFYGCLLAHELAHSIVARRHKITVDGIVLWMLGGVSRLKGEAADPATEATIAIVGPATSAVLGLVFFGLSRLAGAGHPDSLLAAGLGWLGWINGALAVFNLLPAFPLDGGRVLRSILWRWHGDKDRATVTSARVGRAIGAGMIAVGGISALFTTVGLSGLWLALVGWFLMRAAQAEAAPSRHAAELRGLKVIDAMTRDPVTVPAWVTVEQLWQEGVAKRRLVSFPVVDADGSFAGLATAARMRRVPLALWPQATVMTAAAPPDRCVTAAPEDDLAVVAHRLSTSEDHRAVVLDANQVVGIVTPFDVEQAIVRRSHGRADQPPPAAMSAGTVA